MLTEQESLIRFGCFAGILLLMALWEALAPRRHLTVRRPLRWLSNLGLVALNSLAVRLLVPLGAVATAIVAQDKCWGLFNNVTLPVWLAVVLSVVALDLVIYLQHVMFHAVPLLWRLHMVHHADLDFDVTTGLRFHTIEILLSMGLKMAAVILLGVPALAVLVFEVLLNATSMFNHGNVRLPRWLDRLLRLLVVTPEMHRVHHSVIVSERAGQLVAAWLGESREHLLSALVLLSGERPVPHIQPLADADASKEAQHLFQAMRSKLGLVPNMYRTLGHAPKVLEAVMAMAQVVRTDLDPKLRELAYLKTVELNDCHY
jgi:sterol desaturase/sphingolipid hydroxylase (fatty acid hydroxylase superfamily)